MYPSVCLGRISCLPASLSACLCAVSDDCDVANNNSETIHLLFGEQRLVATPPSPFSPFSRGSDGSMPPGDYIEVSRVYGLTIRAYSCSYSLIIDSKETPLERRRQLRNKPCTQCRFLVRAKSPFT